MSANRAKEADAPKKAMDAETDPALKDDLKARYDEAAKRGPNGAYRLGVTAISAGAGRCHGKCGAILAICRGELPAGVRRRQGEADCGHFGQ